MGWTPDALPDLSGKTYVVTGGNSGLGLEATKILSGKGARVILTARSEAKATGAMAAVRELVPEAKLEWVRLDLSDLDSVSEAAAAIAERCTGLDAVINNAGVMQTPERRTAQGFELQLATNHLGHFRLDADLFPLLEAAGGRVVAVSSIAHKLGRIHLDDLQLTQGYDASKAYFQSKLANLMYALELQRRLQARGSAVTAYACHPGYAATNLQSTGVGMEGGSVLLRWIYALGNAVVAQSAHRGAWPLCLAAADPEAEPGAYYGPTGIGDALGPVGRSAIAPRALDEEVARALWEKTEEAVGPFFA